MNPTPGTATVPERSLLQELTRQDVARRAQDAVAVVPIAACEQHGPHLPLGTDLIVAEAVAAAAAESLAGTLDVVVAPSIAVGYSPYHVPLGATLTLDMDTLSAQVLAVCEGLVSSGFRRIFLLNGHGGNAELLMVLARRAAAQHQVLTGAGSYWVMAWNELVAAGAQDRGRLPGHAGAFETSLMLALRPDLVTDPPLRPADFTANPAGYFGPYFVADPQAWAETDGFSDCPAAASAADGRRYLEVVVTAVSSALEDFGGRDKPA